jgi:CRISPR-associated protein (TIGR03986 family)
MNPKHGLVESEKAVAPYNFIELPEKIVRAELEENGKLRSNDAYYQDRYTGRIKCTLTTSSPLYIRCGLTQEQFKEEQEQLRQDRKVSVYPAFFYNPATNKPEIPGSSLRGMFRTLIEIISFSKIDKVSDAQKFFFRAVAADKDDPLKDEYVKYLGNQGRNVKAGYLKFKANKWFIHPAKDIRNFPFVWIKENKVISSDITGYIPLSNISDDTQKYRPQYFINISFGNIQTKNNRQFAQDISSNSQTYEYIGVLLTSGNMLESSTIDTTDVKRKNHCLIREPDNDQNPIPIDDDAIQDYKKSLTAFQKQNPPFDPEMGVLKQGRAIFYCQDRPGQPIRLFGQSPNFRIPYYPLGYNKAVSAVDFIPHKLRKTSIIDIADAIFGFVRSEKQPEEIEQSRAGKIFISNAQCTTDHNKIWLEDLPITPQILASPKPTTFQHYLVQPEKKDTDKKKLKHYASVPMTDTVIRGHKFYWHKGNSPEIKNSDLDIDSSQTTRIKPINFGVTFDFIIHFENLTNVELGALMWVLDISQNNKYRLSLGMGKPLGMGAVKIKADLYLEQRVNRYNQLFNRNEWNIPEMVHETDKFKNEFEKYVLTELKEPSPFNKLPRIKMLLAMLTWQENPSPDYLDQTRYMEIKRQKNPCIGNDPNEYKERPVLPTPLQVIKELNLPNDVEVSFTEGQIVDACVTKIEYKPVQKGNKTVFATTISYTIKGSDCLSIEEVKNKDTSLSIGDIVEVTIIKVKDVSVRKVKRYKNNE